MSFLSKCTSIVENHVPSGVQVATKYAMSQLEKGIGFRGRAILIGAGIVSALETLTMLALNVITSIGCGITSGQSKELNHLSIALRNQVVENGKSVVSLFTRGIINPRLAISTSALSDEAESPVIVNDYHLRLITVLNENQKKLEKEKDPDLAEIEKRYGL